MGIIISISLPLDTSSHQRLNKIFPISKITEITEWSGVEWWWWKGVWDIEEMSFEVSKLSINQIKSISSCCVVDECLWKMRQIRYWNCFLHSFYSRESRELYQLLITIYPSTQIQQWIFLFFFLKFSSVLEDIKTFQVPLRMSGWVLKTFLS